MANRLALSQSALRSVGMNEARKLVSRVTRKTLNRSAVLAPVDTGYMRSTGKSDIRERGSRVVGTVEYTAKYSMAVHEGRRALTIRPKRANGRLVFQVNGRTVYARVVHQKARPGRPFLADALRQVSAQEGFVFTRTMT